MLHCSLGVSWGEKPGKRLYSRSFLGLLPALPYHHWGWASDLDDEMCFPSGFVMLWHDSETSSVTSWRCCLLEREHMVSRGQWLCVSVGVSWCVGLWQQRWSKWVWNPNGNLMVKCHRVPLRTGVCLGFVRFLTSRLFLSCLSQAGRAKF